MIRTFFTLAALALVLPACQADQSGTNAVSGTVLDQRFDGMSGVAEFIGGDYIVTLSDDPNFTCTSSPLGDYLTVEMFNIDGSGGFDASGNVTFNEIAGGVVEQEAAQSGSFDVTVMSDVDGGEVLQGSIDAIGPTSSVGGSFEVPVCD
ncbi:hypothetical protein FIV42_18720 [Persicimonas caeni]|uniref:Uncharacterized protein n=1 Tax=Persicimonas caeni TaxID=2292766 RepID=A0A4Y6PXG8_PERCE|nr:hypothetical protein [Persicimonas caeni]QDG52697.1 hypothetical protein FIV42_18720 [Persicimonas caeni]QED33919.1 hypothetical protein FRD00_18715 [Persicimonas caeni]